MYDPRHDGIDWWVIAGWVTAARHPDLSDDHLVNMIANAPDEAPHPVWIRSYRDGVEWFRQLDLLTCPIRPALV